MSESRSTLLWLVAGVLGMAGLLLVTRFGVAVGLALIVAFSTPTLAGSAPRWQMLALSGLASGFGMLWLLLVAGEVMAGVALHGSVAGHVLFGIVVLALGILLGLWQLLWGRPMDDAPQRRLAAGERPAYWVKAEYWDRSAKWSRPAPVPVELRAHQSAIRRRTPPA